MTTSTALIGKRILVVEDETLIALEIAAILEEAGAEVIGPANTIGQAHQLIEQSATDLRAALLDINVAGASIDSVIGALGGLGVPYACMTGYAAEEATGLSPAIPVIRKPFAPEQILATVAALMER